MSTLGQRKSIKIRQVNSERQLLQIDHQKMARYNRWLTCFAFVFKRSRSKSPISSSSSSLSSPTTTSTTTTTTTTPITLALDHSWSDDDKDKISEKHNYPYCSSLPTTPISSLSPPPRHSMVRQSRARSLTPLDTPFPLAGSPPPPLPTARQQRRTTLPVLRLSLNVDQRLSTHASSDNESDLVNHNDDPSIIEQWQQEEAQRSNDLLDQDTFHPLLYHPVYKH